jgi:single-strand DNA-binding protein
MMNVVVLIGRMVADPELKYTPSGIAVCSFTIAVDKWTKSESGESQKEADFIDIVAWRQSAEFAANYLGKGRLVAVHGRLQKRSWVQQDGQKRWKTEVVASDLRALDRPKEGQAREPATEAAAESAPTDAPAGAAETDMDYDPFAEE